MNKRETECSICEIVFLHFNAGLIRCQTSLPLTYDQQEGSGCEKENNVENLAGKKRSMKSSSHRMAYINYTANN